MGSLFDSALVRTAALLLSVVLHAAVLALLIFADAPPKQQHIEVELYSPPPLDDGTPPPPAEEPDLTEPVPAGIDAMPDGTMPVPSAAPRGYRARLRERERAFQISMSARKDRLDALDRWRDSDGPADAEEVLVRVCGARELSEPVLVTREKDMERYAVFVPTGLFPSSYFVGMSQVLGRRSGPRALGRYELALPPRSTTVQLDDPVGTVLSVGRDDARCLVGFSWHRETVFPLRFSHVPARWVSTSDEVFEVQIEVDVWEDGTFQLKVLDGDTLPFARATLYDQKTVARNLSRHARGARVVRGLIESLFGG